MPTVYPISYPTHHPPLTAIAVEDRAGLHPRLEVVPTSLVPTPQKNMAGAAKKMLSLPVLVYIHNVIQAQDRRRYTDQSLNIMYVCMLNLYTNEHNI